MTLEDRIREGLGATARQVEASSPMPLRDLERAAGRRTIIRRAGWSAAGLGAMSLIVLLAMAGTAPNPLEPAADDSEILLVDETFFGPAPSFDTTQLGRDVSFSPITDVDAVLQAVEDDEDTGPFPSRETFRVALLGETPEGWAVYVTHGTTERDGVPVQERCVWTLSGSGQCTQRDLSGLGPGELIPPAEYGALALPGYSVGEPSDLQWEVAPGTAAVMLTIDGERSWMRPVDQVAVFIVDLRGGEQIFATAFDANGSVVATNSFVPDSPDGVPIAASCPVTIPSGEGNSRPENYPREPGAGDAWYGTDQLWTLLPIDGAYQGRKSVWWSENYPGGGEEEQPPIRVTWIRLDVDADPIVVEEGTNAHTPEDGWFMIAGIDPREAGCWQVTAEYKGATLSYVYVQR